MSHPIHHAQSSVKKWGGKIEDYLPVHDFLDSSKTHFADFRHRAVYHHSAGIFECERTLGHSITNSDGKIVPVRYIAERHVLEDCGGVIPTLADWFRNIKREVWMSHGYTIPEGE